MDNAQSLIQAYNTGFYICLTLCILALIGAVALFFLFDIRTNFLLRTNRAQQISVMKMREKNAQTDPLVNPQAVDMDFSSGEMTDSAEGALEQTSETEALSDQPLQPADQTSWITQTAVSAATQAIRFEVTEDTVVIHTEEVI